MTLLIKRVFRLSVTAVLSATVWSAQAGITTVSDTTNYVTGLAVTDDDAVWAAREVEDFGNVTKLRRTDKNNPQLPSEVIHEERFTGGAIAIDSLTTADVGGTRYVYFVVNKYYSSQSSTNPGRHLSYINRIPIAGGPVKGIASPLPMGQNDLKTDGSYVYWVDREAVRKVPMDGGTATILARVPNIQFPNREYVKQIALDSHYVYYNSGNSGESIYRVPKAGGTPTIQLIAASTVTDLFVHENGGQSMVYWSESNGSVKSLNVADGRADVYQRAMEDTEARSVAFDGTRVVWASCKIYHGGRCHLHAFENGRTLVLDPLESHSVFMGNIVAEPTQIFFSSYFYDTVRRSAVLKYVHPAPLTVSINPSPVYKIGSTKPGVNSVSETVYAIVSGGDPYAPGQHTYSYSYAWGIDTGFFNLHDPVAPSTSIFAAMPDGDSRDGTLTLYVTDSAGRTATAQTSVWFENPLNPGDGLPQ